MQSNTDMLRDENKAVFMVFMVLWWWWWGAEDKTTDPSQLPCAYICVCVCVVWGGLN